jgi:DNA primase
LAAFIPEDKISSIKNAADIVDIVSESVALRQSGRNYLGLCPFHSEKTPSFTVSPDKQIYYCFGCGAGGNVFSFLMKHRGLSFPEAARTLAGRYGIDLPTRNLSPYEKKKLTERETILNLNGEAMDFYRHCLKTGENGKRAVTYLLKRGLTRQTIDRFKLGYAPDGWDHLLRRLKSRKQSIEMALSAGLIIPRKKGSGHYDRFRNRIVFPIFNGQNQIVGFGGRVMDDGLPKYLNSPETPVYHKSRSLYGLNWARQRSREKQAIFIVEGYFDLIAMHQFGIENTVATLGTSLTADHVQLLKGCVGEGGHAVLVYDSDQAGIKAARRSVDVFQKGLLDSRILVLPEGHDPDSFLMDNGPDDFLNAAGQAAGMIAFMIQSAIDRYGLGINGKVRVVNELTPAILAVSDPIARSLQVKHLAERIGVDEAVLMQKMRQSVSPPARTSWRSDADGPAASSPPVSARGAAYRLEERLVAMMLQFSQMIAEIKQRRLMDHFSDPVLAEIAKGIIEQSGDGATDIPGLIARWDDPEKKAIVARLSLTEEHWDSEGCRRLIDQFEVSIRRRTRGYSGALKLRKKAEM